MLFYINMVELLDLVVNTFELEKFTPEKLKTMNRKTMLDWFFRTKWKRRMEEHSMSCCVGKKKSVVARCKKGSKRPIYAQNLKILST